MLYALDSIMKCKVLYTSIILLIFSLSEGYSQKSRLNLLPSSESELMQYDMESYELEKSRSISEPGYSDDVNIITPDISRDERSSKKKERRLCKIIGSFCKKEWSAGMIKMFRLPTADIRIH